MMTPILRITFYPMLALLSLSLSVLVIVGVSWWVPLFADKKDNLPDWLKGFETFDALLDEAWRCGYLSPS